MRSAIDTFIGGSVDVQASTSASIVAYAPHAADQDGSVAAGTLGYVVQLGLRGVRGRRPGLTEHHIAQADAEHREQQRIVHDKRHQNRDTLEWNESRSSS